MKATLNLILLSCFASLMHNAGASSELLIPIEPQVTEAPETSLTAAYESRYILEGRDALESDGLYYTDLMTSYKNMAFGAFYGRGTGNDYDELQLSATISGKVKDLEWSLGYTHLRFFEDRARDHEIHLHLEHHLCCGILIESEIYYGVESSEFFIENAISRNFKISDRINIEPLATIAFNGGFVDDGHRGANHVEATIKTTYELNHNCLIGCHTAYVLPVNRHESLTGDDTLRKKLHAEFFVEYSF